MIGCKYFKSSEKKVWKWRFDFKNSSNLREKLILRCKSVFGTGFFWWFFPKSHRSKNDLSQKYVKKWKSICSCLSTPLLYNGISEGACDHLSGTHFKNPQAIYSGTRIKKVGLWSRPFFLKAKTSSAENSRILDFLESMESLRKKANYGHFQPK